MPVFVPAGKVFVATAGLNADEEVVADVVEAVAAVNVEVALAAVAVPTATGLKGMMLVLVDALGTTAGWRGCSSFQSVKALAIPTE